MTHPPRASVAEVFRIFLKLGLTSFGGPVAHLGYFRDELVSRRKWLTDQAYADLVALCQFLPGPASSQVGFGLGLLRAGPMGALAAFAGFTLPSALVLVVFALTATRLNDPVTAGALAGLKIVAVAIVAQAVWGMSRTLCPDRTRASIALAAVVILGFAPSPFAMPAAILFGALAGLAMLRQAAAASFHPLPVPISRRVALAALAICGGLLVGLPFAAPLSPGIALFDGFYRAGALVFGGGHVVLPLLQTEMVPHWMQADAFLAGYGATQAVPGPLFTFAAYLGTLSGGLAGAAVALLAIFLPGFLLLIGVLPFWANLRQQTQVQSALHGANAAVVGILGAALYTPVFTSSVTDLRDFSLALGCFVLLTVWKFPPWIVVITGALGGVALTFLG